MREKIVSFFKNAKKSEIIVASLCLVMTAVITGSLAYIMSETGAVENTFELTEMPNEVYEKIEGSEKKDVKIVNLSDKDAYIRAKVVATWVKDGEVYGSLPVESTDYSITWTKDGWDEYPENSGVYYYTNPVKFQQSTGILFTDCSPILTNGNTLNQPEGYKLSIEIIAQSIQATGTDENGNKPIELAWGVDIKNGNVVAATITEQGGN